MSPRTKVTREQWIVAASRLLAQGLVPADVPLSDLCGRLGVTKGSFYSHFPRGLEELHREIIARWLRDSAADGLAAAMKAVRDPRDRLRLLRARGLETAQRDGAMRRWASKDPAVASAVAYLDAEVIAHATRALSDLGLPGEEAAVLAEVVVHAFAGAHHFLPAPPRSDPARFEALLAILTRAAAGPARAGQDDGLVDVTAGAAPDEVVLFTIAQGLPVEARKDLRERAQRFAEQAAARAASAPRGRGPAAEAGRGGGARRGTGT